MYTGYLNVGPDDNYVPSESAADIAANVTGIDTSYHGSRTEAQFDNYNVTVQMTDRNGQGVLTELSNATLTDFSMSGNETDIETRPHHGGHIELARPHTNYEVTLTFSVSPTTADGLSNITQRLFGTTEPTPARRKQTKRKISKDVFERLAEVLNNE